MPLDRKRVYLRWIGEGLHRLLDLQDMKEGSDTYGCFFKDGWKNYEDYFNSRWQEAVLTLAWVNSQKKKKALEERIRAGIDFWCKLQNKDGSFPESFNGERSFSATAFSTFAIAESARMVGMDEKWRGPLEKAGVWLTKNDETILTNQQAAAMLSLMKLYQVLGQKRFLKAAEDKKKSIISSQSPDGWFPEKQQPDLSYSSLVIEMLGIWKKERNDRKVDGSARRYFTMFKEFLFRDGTFGGTYNSRTTGWVILDSLELFPNIPETREILHSLFECYNDKIGNIQHLPDDRHLCTDLYRICFAYDNASSVTKPLGFETGIVRFSSSGLVIRKGEMYSAITDKQHTSLYSLWGAGGLRVFAARPGKRDVPSSMNLLKKMGMHRFRKVKYMIGARKKRDGRVTFLLKEVLVESKSEGTLLLAYGKGCKVKKSQGKIHLTDSLGGITIKSGTGMRIKDHGRTPVPDSLFYGDRSLGLVEIRFQPLRNSYKYSIAFD